MSRNCDDTAPAFQTYPPAFFVRSLPDIPALVPLIHVTSSPVVVTGAGVGAGTNPILTFSSVAPTFLMDVSTRNG